MAGGEELEVSRRLTAKIKSRLERLNQQTLARTPGRPKWTFGTRADPRDPKASVQVRSARTRKSGNGVIPAPVSRLIT